MADISEVIEELGKSIDKAVYPKGINQPSIVSAPVKISQGWPLESELTSTLPSGGVIISMFPRPGDQITNTTMGEIDWEEQSSDGANDRLVRELRRQTKTIQITIWASNQKRRDLLAKSLDVELSTLKNIKLPDGSVGILRYVNSIQDDLLQKQGIYRRDLMFSVNYAITQTMDGFAIKEIDADVQANGVGVKISTTI